MRAFWGIFLLTQLVWAQPRWEPDHSYVLVASLTHWPAAAGLANFPGNRRDGDLVRVFEQAGVPRGHIVFLKDSQATHAGILRELRALAAQAGAQDTLFFYFQGHGMPGLFCCYDYDSKRPQQTALRAEELFPLLQATWKGARLFLVGDCCSSGCLESVVGQVEQGRREVRVAGLASATASNQSTGNWTFTEGLLRILSGDPLVDRNRDGLISFREGDAFLHDQMKYKEDQLCSLVTSANFEADFVWRKAVPGRPPLTGPYALGEILSAQDREGNWYRSEVLDEKEGRYKVHYNGWDARWDEWVEPSKLRPIEAKALNPGGTYEVQREGKWLPAVLSAQVENYFYFAHYLHEAGEADEWITGQRARPAAPVAPAFQAPQAGPLTLGQWVAAQWHGRWYRARITGQSDGLFAVRYDDDTQGHLIAAELIPMALPQPGQRVLAVRDGEGRMFPGRWRGREVEWEDGVEATPVAVEKLAPIRSSD